MWPDIGSPRGEWKKFWPSTVTWRECAVLGVNDDLKGQVPIGLRGAQSGGNTRQERPSWLSWSKWCASRSAPLPASNRRWWWNRLPKTRSGKILRGTMRKIADSEEFRMPSTIDDPTVLGEIEGALKTIGYGKKE